MEIKVLIVDDSLVIRKSLEKELSKYNDIKVVGSAADPFEARNLVVSLNPDVLTLDIDMPKMDGITFLKKIMKHRPVPVIVLSSVAKKGSEEALEATRHGAVDVVAKPDHSVGLADVTKTLVDKIRAAKHANVAKLLGNIDSSDSAVLKQSLGRATNKVIVIGASTGGTNAVETLLKTFPPDAPPTLITQHMPAGFTKSFAKRLDSICDISVKEAEDRDPLLPGTALVAPGGFHLLVKRVGTSLCAEVKGGPAVGNHKPSVDVLFRSAAQVLGKRAVGVILTGMGADGAEGMKTMKDAGAFNIAQNEETCVVFGMPRVAIEKGGVDEVLPLKEIGKRLFDVLKR